MMRDLLQPMHLLVIIAVFVLLFGGKKIPELAKGLGEGIKNFKSAMRETTGNPDAPPDDEKKSS
jgi:sec-independent protein translocase protein TatA